MHIFVPINSQVIALSVDNLGVQPSLVTALYYRVLKQAIHKECCRGEVIVSCLFHNFITD